MNINENTRLIDLKVSDLLEILKDTILVQPVHPQPEEDEFGGYELVERITGYARQTLYQLKSDGELPSIAVPGGGVRFSRLSIVKWLQSNKKLTNSEIEDKAVDLNFRRKLRRR